MVLKKNQSGWEEALDHGDISQKDSEVMVAGKFLIVVLTTHNIG